MKIVLFDTETTSLIQNSAQSIDKQPHIIELYGCLLDDETGAVLKEVDFLCNPGIDIPSEVTRITGLKNEDFKGLEKFGAHLEEVKNLFEEADGMCAHNLSYDHAVLGFELQRLKASMQWPKIKICTVEATEHFKGHRLSLTDLHQHLFEKPFEGSHRAKNDVEALVRCYLKLKEKGEL